MAKSKKKKVEPIHFEEKIEAIEEQVEVNDKEIVIEAEPIDIEAVKETIIVTTTAPLNIREKNTRYSKNIFYIMKHICLPSVKNIPPQAGIFCQKRRILVSEEKHVIE